MQFDRTQIVIRQRSPAEVMDLSLAFMRRYWRAIFLWSLPGVAILFVVNGIVTWWMLDYERLLLLQPFDESLSSLRLRFMFVQSVLVFFEAPLALIGLTYYLGQVVFRERPSYRDAIREIAARAWEVILLLGILRGGLLIIAIIGSITVLVGDTASTIWIVTGAVLYCGIVFLVRMFRPFAPEIIVLEQSPLRRRSSSPLVQQTYVRRSFGLHTNLVPELMAAGLLGLFVFSSLTLSVVLCQALLIQGLFSLSWSWWCDAMLYPISLWIVAIFATVFRFLNYIDCRIRKEGWELDLALRAEAQRWLAA